MFRTQTENHHYYTFTQSILVVVEACSELKLKIIITTHSHNLLIKINLQNVKIIILQIQHLFFFFSKNPSMTYLISIFNNKQECWYGKTDKLRKVQNSNPLQIIKHYVWICTYCLPWSESPKDRWSCCILWAAVPSQCCPPLSPRTLQNKQVHAGLSNSAHHLKQTKNMCHGPCSQQCTLFLGHAFFFFFF